MPSASSRIATHRFDRCQRCLSRKPLPRIRSAALGLFRDPAEQGLDPLLHEKDGGRTRKRDRRGGVDRVDDLGAAFARAQLDRADVIANRQAGEERVGEAIGPLIGEHFLAHRRPGQSEDADRADAVGLRLPLALELGSAQLGDLGIAPVVGEDVEDDLGRGGHLAHVSEARHCLEGYVSRHRCGSDPSSPSTSPSITRWSRQERTICRTQALAGLLTISGPMMSSTISKAVRPPFPSAARTFPSSSSTWRRDSAIFASGSRKVRPWPGRTRSKSSPSTTSRLGRNSPTGSGLWPWSKKRTVRPRRWSPEISSLPPGWRRKKGEG